MPYHYRSLLLFGLLLGAMLRALSARAADETYTNALDAPELQIGKAFRVWDARFLTPGNPWNAGWDDDILTQTVDNYLVLDVDPLRGTQPSEPFTLTVVADVQSVRERGGRLDTTAVGKVKLTVDYDPAAGSRYVHRQAYPFAGGHELIVTLLDVQLDGKTTLNDLGSVVRLAAHIDVERYFAFDRAAVSGLAHTYLSGTNELVLSWQAQPGAESYQLEWTWVDNYDGQGGRRSIGNLGYDFARNATRVEVQERSYRVPMIYEQGYFVYRVRAVGRGQLRPDQLSHGAWSLPDQGPISILTAPFPIRNAYEITAAAAHTADQMNWQYESTFTEGGRRRETLTYADALLNERQLLTRVNSEAHVLVEERFYDHQGRATLRTLPAPPVVSERNGAAPQPLRYYPDFTLNADGAPLTRGDFDAGTDNCDRPVPQLSTQAGAARYYSPNNPDQTGARAFLPDAAGYPYLQMEYTPDRTGRVRRTGGPGEHHHLGSGREVKHYYEVPSQVELDRLFGTEVGEARHYRKEIRVDENGQATVRYLDLADRVVAAALAGTPPASLEGIEGSDARTDVVAELVGEWGRVDTNRHQLTVRRDFTVLEDGTGYTFAYRMTPEAFGDTTCPTLPVCYDCAYEWEMYVLDDCGEVVWRNRRVVGDEEGIDRLCGGRIDLQDSVALRLDRGAYQLIKVLRVDAAAAEAYADDYLAENVCIDSLREALETKYWEEVDTMSCYTECAACDVPESYQVTNADGTTEVITLDPADRARLEAECRESSCRTFTSPCDAARRAMLADVSPGGQYALYYDSLTQDIAPGRFPLSVLNDMRTQDTPGQNWRHPSTPYLDGRGQPAWVILDGDGKPSHDRTRAVTLADGRRAVPPQYLHRVEDFIRHWQRSWAASLLPYHPEYCSLDWCNTVVVSDTFDFRLRAVGDYPTAASADWLDPLGRRGGGITDPYFQDTTDPGVRWRYDLMRTLLDSVYADPNGAKYDIEEVVSAAQRCNNPNMTYAQFRACVGSARMGQGVSPEMRDAEWRLYRDLYLSKKARVQSIERQIAALNGGCYAGCIGGPGRTDPVIRSQVALIEFFVFNSSFGDDSLRRAFEAMPCFGSSPPLYAGKQRRFVDEYDLGDAFDMVLTGDLNEDLARMTERADAELYDRCGRCPLVVDVETFLTNLAYRGGLLGTVRNVLVYPYGLTRDMLDALPHPDKLRYIWRGTSGGASFTGPLLTTQGTELTLALTAEDGQPLDYDAVEQFSCLAYEAGAGGRPGGGFRVQAHLADGTTRAVVGSTDRWDLSNCPDLAAVCTRTPELVALEDIFTKLFYVGLQVAPNFSIAHKPLYDPIFGAPGREILLWRFVDTATAGQLTGRLLIGSPNEKTFRDTCEVLFEVLSGDYAFGERLTTVSMVPERNDDPTCEQTSALVIATGPRGPVRLRMTNTCYTLANCCREAAPCPELIINGDFVDERRGWTTDLLFDPDTLRPGTYRIDDHSGNPWFPYWGTYRSVGEREQWITTTTLPSLDLAEVLRPLGSTAAPWLKQLAKTPAAKTRPLPGRPSGEETFEQPRGAEAEFVPVPGPAGKYLAFTPFGAGAFDVWSQQVTLEAGQTYRWRMRAAASIFGDFYGFAGYYTPRVALKVGEQSVTLDVDEVDQNAPYVRMSAEFTVPAGGPVTISVRYEPQGSEGETVWFLDDLSLRATTCDAAPTSCCVPPPGPFSAGVPTRNDCVDSYRTVVEENVRNELDAHRVALRRDLRARYLAHCLRAQETLTMRYQDPSYHYTLSYYDQAGNLQRTVPPAAVRPITDEGQLRQVVAERAARRVLRPEHVWPLTTTYRHHSLRVPTDERTPDGGTTRYWYDPTGRVLAEQDAEQQSRGTYQVFQYDTRDRLIMKAETKPSDEPYPAEPIIVDGRTYSALLAGTLRDVERYYYDEPMNAGVAAYFGAGGQTFVRNRVASVTFAARNTGPGDYDHATHFAYDVHGHVNTLLREFPELAKFEQRIKRVEYDYDLISGNVNRVWYQRGQPDQFIHRYTYDADNRLLNVATSQDGYFWEDDARYTFYPHGPTARRELGHELIQGVDYAYTILGRLKGINAENRDPGRDMGGDARTGGANALFLPDATSFVLGYHAGDYRAVGGNDWLSDAGNLWNNASGLYNGNVGWMTTHLPDLTPQATYYTYDQLGRLTRSTTSDQFDAVGNGWGGRPQGDYGTAYAYDANGNLLTLTRAGSSDSASLEMDELTYHYAPNTNQLTHVDDAVDPGRYAGDLDDQDPDNYAYDLVGQLVRDRAGRIERVEWNSQHRMTAVVTKDDTRLDFTYDAQGLRTTKSDGASKTFYVRDADGQILATYQLGDEGLRRTDVPLYGAERLGSWRPSVTDEPSDPWTHRRGERSYELTNHLGNVLTTVSDRRTRDQQKQVAADVGTVNDYYPYGAPQPGRTLAGRGYRWGFNGQERDDEIKGEGNSYTAPYWQYSPQVVQRWNVDPKANPAMSPYAVMAGNPIMYADPKGDTVIILVDPKVVFGNGHMAMAFQNEKGEWWYYSQAYNDMSYTSRLGGTELLFKLLTGGIAGGDLDAAVQLQKVAGVTSASDVAKKMAAGYDLYKYKAQAVINTTSEQDKQIAKNADTSAKKHNSGEWKYHLYSKNCVDAIQWIISTKTGIELPFEGRGPADQSPNHYYTNKLVEFEYEHNNPKASDLTERERWMLKTKAATELNASQE
ncbi:MAG: hypothetical protein WBA12_00990 [Catalinimonas sp.]